VVGAPPETAEHATTFANAARQSAPSAARPGDCKFTSTPEASSSIGRLAATTAIRELCTNTRLILYEGSRTPTIADGVDRSTQGLGSRPNCLRPAVLVQPNSAYSAEKLCLKSMMERRPTRFDTWIACVHPA